MREIEHIFQPNPLACGQAVIAMLTGTDVYKIIELIGTERETTLADMKKLLTHFGFTVSGERKQARVISDLFEISLLSLETPSCWHWSLYAFGKVYDPEYGVLDDFPLSDRKYFWSIKAAT